MKPKIIYGGKISPRDLKQLINLSYESDLKDYKNYTVDKYISGQRVKVFVDNKTGKVYVVHRGTWSLNDVWTDIKLGFNYKGSTRFKHAERIQKLAEAKYGKEHITTLGHSLGASLANEYGKETDQIINLNRPVFPSNFYNEKPSNSTDINSSYDPISVLRHFEKKNGKEIIIPSESYNLGKEHTAIVLDRLPEDTIIGTGLNKWINHVKQTQIKNKVSYKEALKIAKSTYKRN